MRRWWIYQRERFPVFSHGLLIAAFSSSAVCFSAQLRGAPVALPSATAFGVAFATCFLFFLQLRIADEFKDFDEDSRFRPYRPVPRGLVKRRELAVVFVLGALLQLGGALLLAPALVWVLAIAWAYLGLMSVEFFAREWLIARPIVYLWTHMLIMPLVDFYATACEWMPAAGSPPSGLGWFLAASFANGIVIETGRKIRARADEEDGVRTYSVLWGRRHAARAWGLVVMATAGCALMAARAIDFLLPVAAALGAGGLGALWMAGSFRDDAPSGTGKRFEVFSGLWTLALYLMLGLVPMIIHRLAA